MKCMWCVCVRVRVRVCVHARACVCVHACACVCVCVFISIFCIYIHNIHCIHLHKAGLYQAKIIASLSLIKKSALAAHEWLLQKPDLVIMTNNMEYVVHGPKIWLFCKKLTCLGA